jgi:hypothetical protein
MIEIEGLYTEKCKPKTYEEENLEFLEETELCTLYYDVLIDPTTSLCLHDIGKVTPISETNYINTFEGLQKVWIRGTPNYATNKQFILNERRSKFANSDIKQRILSKQIKQLDSEYTYINLLTSGSYAYGHLLDVTLKLFYLPKNIKNPCFLVSPHQNINNFEYIVKTVSGYQNATFQVIRSSDKFAYKANKMYELKQANGFTNFRDGEQYKTFISKFSKEITFTEKKYKVFLTRIPPTKRHIINFQELENKLREQGVIIISGKETFLERINLISNSTHVSGYHGALFFDTCFSPKDCKILEYAPIKRPAKCFLRAYKQCNNYYMKFIDTPDDLNCVLDIEETLAFFNQ